jgi:hypothetical protein
VDFVLKQNHLFAFMSDRKRRSVGDGHTHTQGAEKKPRFAGTRR